MIPQPAPALDSSSVTTNGSHAPQTSVVRRVVSLLAGERVSLFVRCITAPIAVALFYFGFDPFFHPNSPAYSRPIFDGVFAAADPRTWGLLWFACGVLMTLSTLTGRAAIYVLGVFVSSLTLGAWASMIVIESRQNSEAELTSGAIGLYILAFVAIIGLAFSPTPLDVDQPIVAMTDDDHVVHLRRVE